MTRWGPHPATLRQLQCVLAVAEHRNFSRAAEACAVAQPSLSSQIAQLEATLRVSVFERIPRNVVVTAAGAALVDRARRLLLDADDLVATAQRSRDPLCGTLRVGVVPTIANIAGAMKSVPEIIRERQIAHFKRADAEYGDRIEKGLARR